MRGSTRVTWLALACAALLTGVKAQASEAISSDGQLEARIDARLAHVTLHQPSNIDVQVKDGRVTLDGQVPTVSDQWSVEKAVRSVTRDYESRLSVQPRRAVADAELGAEIAKEILGYPYYGVFDAVGYQVHDGVVRLTGSVHRPYHASDIEQIVARLDGVRRLTSDIEVQPLSPFDETLRWECFRAIYGNTAFSRFAYFPDPPVRILVDHGRVTLAGSVTNTADRDLLTILASGVPSFGPIKNEVRIEKPQPKHGAPAPARAPEEAETLTTV